TSVASSVAPFAIAATSAKRLPEPATGSQTVSPSASSAAKAIAAATVPGSAPSRAGAARRVVMVLDLLGEIEGLVDDDQAQRPAGVGQRHAARRQLASDPAHQVLP